MKRPLLIISLCSATFLSGCIETAQPLHKKTPLTIDYNQSTLHAWWTFFDDPVLTKLVSSALSLNPQNTTSNKNTQTNNPEHKMVMAIIHEYINYRYIQLKRALLLDYTLASNKEENATNTLTEQGNALKKQESDIIDSLAHITKLLPDYTHEILKSTAPFPKTDITKILASEIETISHAPDMLTLSAQYNKNIPYTFETTTIGEFFGISDNIFTDQHAQWSITRGHAEKSIKRDYPTIDKRVINFVNDLEYKINTYAHLREQANLLDSAAKNNISSDINEIYRSKIAAHDAQYETIKSFLAIYNTLGVY